MKLTVKLTEWIGTPTSLLIHIIWFVIWFLIKIDINILTMLVSLEAIFLSIFIQMSVNNHHQTSKRMHSKILDIEEKIEENK